MVEDYVIYCPCKVIIIPEQQFSIMASAHFLDVSKEETSKLKVNAVALIITRAIILKQLFSSGSVKIVLLRLGDSSTKFTDPSANNS